MVPIDQIIKGLKSAMSILDIFVFGVDKVKRIQRDKQYEQDSHSSYREPSRRKGKQ